MGCGETKRVSKAGINKREIAAEYLRQFSFAGDCSDTLRAMQEIICYKDSLIAIIEKEKISAEKRAERYKIGMIATIGLVISGWAMFILKKLKIIE